MAAQTPGERAFPWPWALQSQITALLFRVAEDLITEAHEEAQDTSVLTGSTSATASRPT